MSSSQLAGGASQSSNQIMRSLLAVAANDLDDALQNAIEHSATAAGVEHSMIALATRNRIEILATLKPDRAGPCRVRSARLTLYDEEILYTDRQIGRLLDALQAAGLNDSTLLVVTSDHGEGLNEHGWWMHGVSVHEGELRVPLIVKLPGQTTARVVTTPTQLADLVPTLTEWLPLGLDKTPITPATARGLSMASALRGEESAGPVRDLHFFRRYHTPFIVAPTFPVRMDGTPSLPKRIEGEELRMRREKWELRYAEEQREAARTTLDEAERTALEALGYVQ